MEIGHQITKLSWKYRIVLGFFIGFLFAGGLSLIDYLLDGAFQSFNSYLFQGLFMAVFITIGFSYSIQKFGTKHASKLAKSIIPTLTENESIEVEGSANLFRGIEGVGGKLFLTNKKIIFKSHKLNIQKGQTTIFYKDITQITKRKTAKLLNNGIRITTNNKNEFDFVVNEREKWIEALNKKRTF